MKPEILRVVWITETYPPFHLGLVRTRDPISGAEHVYVGTAGRATESADIRNIIDNGQKMKIGVFRRRFGTLLEAIDEE